MSLLSLFFVALLAVLAAAQWHDVMLVHVFNATTVKLCAVDNPNVCIFGVVINKTYNPFTTAVVARWVSYSHPWHVDIMTDAHVLSPWTVVVADPANLQDMDIYVPESGYIYSDDPWLAVDDTAPDTYTVCGRNITAVRVARGRYRITAGGASPIYLMLPSCARIPLVVFAYSTPNFTTPWAFLYIISMPTAREVGRDHYFYIFNGTRHTYYVVLNAHWTGGVPVGGGYYIANRTMWLNSALYYERHDTAYGPRLHENATGGTPLSAYDSIVFYTIGKTPGDGVFIIGLEELAMRNLLTDKMEFTFVSDDYGGYFVLSGGVWRAILNSPLHKRFVFTYAKRYSIGEAAVKTPLYVFTTRTVACPVYDGMFSADSPYRAVLTRADTAKEVAICSNATRTLYLRLAVPNAHGMLDGHSFADAVAPGRCSRLRWPGNIAASSTRLYIYADAQSFCRHQYIYEKVGGQDYLAGWAYYLTDDGSLIPAYPIDPDALYAEMWRRIIETMARQYNETARAFQQWLQMQENATRRIEDYYRSLPQYQGTIRMDSSTSAWLQTVYNAILTYTASMPGGGGFAPVTAPVVPLAVAPAAAAAVAVAWAASRRDDDVVTTAAVAGIALALFGILMMLIYGPASLPLVALGIIIAAAAAAWRRL